VERETQVDLSQFHTVSLVLRNPDFTATRDMAAAIDKEFQKPVATQLDNRTVQIDVAGTGITSVPLLISRVQALSINFHSPAKVVINERTGTIVMGGNVTLSPVSVLHGSLSIQVETRYDAVPVIATGKEGTPPTVASTTIANTTVAVKDQPAQSIRLDNGANVDDLIRGLHAIGATSHDIVAILQAIKSSGGLQADLEVI
jgi:flagellar P-ring protein precursor FlgI